LKAASSIYFAFSAGRSLGAICALLFCCVRAVGQDAVPADLTQPNQPALSPREVDILRSQSSNSNPSVNGATLAETPRRLSYAVSASVRAVYDDNINISSFDPQSDFYFAIEPALSIGLGGQEAEGSSSLSLVYRPSIFLFADHSDRDTVQHLIRLQAAHRFARLAVSLSQDVQVLDGTDLNSLSDPTGHNANIDVGQTARHNIFTTQLGDSYDLTGKLFLTNSVSFVVDNYPSSLIGSKNFFGNLFINYTYSGKVVLGLGGTGGYNTVEQNSPNQTYEQANVRVSYAATGKLSLNASGGVEFRQFENNSRGTYVSPVYEIDANYQPFDGTSINLTGTRRTENSASLSGQDYASTEVHLTINQRFLHRFILGLTTGYENLNYFSTIQGLTATRNDDFYYIQPSVDVTIMRFWTAGVYYLHRKNASSFDFFSFDDNQVGLRSTATF
jgi:hypothetical protein